MTKKALALEVIGRLKQAYPLAECTLDYAHAWQLLVEVRLAAEGREAVLAVANRGPLIAPEDLAHVFDRFFRVDAARTRADAPDDGQPAAGGWGLGLAIAHEIARDHGGAIAAASIPEPGTGAARTTFTVRLPRA